MTQPLRHKQISTTKGRAENIIPPHTLRPNVAFSFGLAENGFITRGSSRTMSKSLAVDHHRLKRQSDWPCNKARNSARRQLSCCISSTGMQRMPAGKVMPCATYNPSLRLRSNTRSLSAPRTSSGPPCSKYHSKSNFPVRNVAYSNSKTPLCSNRF